VELLRYKRARFSAWFPRDYRYSHSHYWMSPGQEEPDLWRVGFTKFATRMLGELVEAEFRIEAGTPVSPGQDIGWVEGFKAASEVYCVMQGTFVGMNEVLRADACIIRSSPYEEGWLYAVRGQPEAESLSVEGYMEFLDSLIERMQRDPQYASD
jgi:glycine cleavage system H protein